MHTMLKTHSFAIGIFALLAMLVPRSTFAAELLFSPSSDSRIVEVHIDPQSKSLNVVEGKIQFSGPAAEGLSVTVENGQSILPIWPTPPVYDGVTKSISFVGGVPNGFSSKGLLFRLRIPPTASGDMTIAYVEGNAYLNDGKGTKEPVYAKTLELNAGNEGMVKQNDASSTAVNTSNTFKYATIILLLAVVLSVMFRYAYKKNYKK